MLTSGPNTTDIGRTLIVHPTRHSTVLMMSTRPFRFCVNMMTAPSRQEWQDKCRRAEDLGFDTIAVPDHLGRPAPFAALVSAAEVTTRPRLGTFVLNVGFTRPALL